MLNLTEDDMKPILIFYYNSSDDHWSVTSNDFSIYDSVAGTNHHTQLNTFLLSYDLYIGENTDYNRLSKVVSVTTQPNSNNENGLMYHVFTRLSDMEFAHIVTYGSGVTKVQLENSGYGTFVL